MDDFAGRARARVLLPTPSVPLPMRGRSEASMRQSKRLTLGQSERRRVPTAKTEVTEGDGSEEEEVAASSAFFPHAALCRSPRSSHNM